MLQAHGGESGSEDMSREGAGASNANTDADWGGVLDPELGVYVAQQPPQQSTQKEDGEEEGVFEREDTGDGQGEVSVASSMSLLGEGGGSATATAGPSQGESAGPGLVGHSKLLKTFDRLFDPALTTWLLEELQITRTWDKLTNGWVGLCVCVCVCSDHADYKAAGGACTDCKEVGLGGCCVCTVYVRALTYGSWRSCRLREVGQADKRV